LVEKQLHWDEGQKKRKFYFFLSLFERELKIIENFQFAQIHFLISGFSSFGNRINVFGGHFWEK